MSMDPFRFFRYEYKTNSFQKIEIDVLRFFTTSGSNGNININNVNNNLYTIYHNKIINIINIIAEYKKITKKLSDYKIKANGNVSTLNTSEKKDITELKINRNKYKKYLDEEVQLVGKMAVKLEEQKYQEYYESPIRAKYDTTKKKWVLLI